MKLGDWEVSKLIKKDAPLMYPFPPKHCIDSFATSTALSVEYNIAPAQSYTKRRCSLSKMTRIIGKNNYPPRNVTFIAGSCNRVNVCATGA